MFNPWNSASCSLHLGSGNCGQSARHPALKFDTVKTWNNLNKNPEKKPETSLSLSLSLSLSPSLSLSLSLPSCVYRIDIFLNNIKSAVDEWRALNSGTYFPNQSFPPIFENAFQERTNQLWTPSCSAFKPKRICCFTTPRRKPTHFFFSRK